MRVFTRYHHKESTLQLKCESKKGNASNVVNLIGWNNLKIANCNPNDQENSWKLTYKKTKNSWKLKVSSTLNAQILPCFIHLLFPKTYAFDQNNPCQ